MLCQVTEGVTVKLVEITKTVDMPTECVDYNVFVKLSKPELCHLGVAFTECRLKNVRVREFHFIFIWITIVLRNRLYIQNITTGMVNILGDDSDGYWRKEVHINNYAIVNSYGDAAAWNVTLRSLEKY